jgi:hypothetical protein
LSWRGFSFSCLSLGISFSWGFRTLLTKSILCTTKLAQGTSQFYFVLPNLHKVLPPSHKQGSPHRRGDVVMLVMWWLWWLTFSTF